MIRKLYKAFFVTIGLLAVDIAGMMGCRHKESEEMPICIGEMREAIHDIEMRGRYRNGWLNDLLERSRDDIKAFGRENILSCFERALFDVRIERLNVRGQLVAIEAVMSAADEIRECSNGSLEADWRIRIKLIDWIRRQFDRIKSVEPETSETRMKEYETWKVYIQSWDETNNAVWRMQVAEWFRAHPVVRIGVTSVRDHEMWLRVANGDKDYVWRRLVEKCVRDIENAALPQDFRNRCKADIEKLMGVSMSDDRFWQITHGHKSLETQRNDIDVEVDL